MELRLSGESGLRLAERVAAEQLVADLLAPAPVHVGDLRALAGAEGAGQPVRAQHALQQAVEVEVGIDAEAETVLDGVDVPDVHGVVDGLDALSQRVPGLAMVAARAEAVRLQLAHADAHLLEVRLAIEAALVADGVDFVDHVAQLGMLLQQLDDLPNLIVEAGAFRRVTRWIIEARLLAEARRKDEVERRLLPLEGAEAFVQPQQNIFRRQLGEAGDLLRGVGRLAEERELEPDGADVAGAIEPAGHVIRRVVVRLASGENQLRQVKDLEVAVELLPLAEADQAIDVPPASHPQHLVPLHLSILLLVT